MILGIGELYAQAPTEQNINTHKSSLPPDYFTKYQTHSNTPKEYPSNN